MFQFDRLVFATNHPDAVDMHLRNKRGLTLTASGQSIPGVSTRIYPFPGGGFLEVAFIESLPEALSTDEGKAMAERLDNQGDSFSALVLETIDLDRVKRVLEAEHYPVTVTPVQQILDPQGKALRFQMLGTYPHLPWFVMYDKPRDTPRGYPQAAVIRTTTWTADVEILEKIIGMPATTIQYPHTTAAMLPLYNASLRIESGDEYGFAYFDPSGLLLDKPIEKEPKTNQH